MIFGIASQGILKILERSVSSLRNNGTPFNKIPYQGENTLEAIGARAETNAGQPVADIVWVRDITHITKDKQPPQGKLSGIREIQNTSGLDDRQIRQVSLMQIPIPIWLRPSSKLHSQTKRLNSLPTKTHAWLKQLECGRGSNRASSR